MLKHVRTNLHLEWVVVTSQQHSSNETFVAFVLEKKTSGRQRINQFRVACSLHVELVPLVLKSTVWYAVVLPPGPSTTLTPGAPASNL